MEEETIHEIPCNFLKLKYLIFVARQGNNLYLMKEGVQWEVKRGPQSVSLIFLGLKVKYLSNLPSQEIEQNGVTNLCPGVFIQMTAFSKCIS